MNELKAFEKYFQITFKMVMPIYIFNKAERFKPGIKIPSSQCQCQNRELPFNKELANVMRKRALPCDFILHFFNFYWNISPS